MNPNDYTLKRNGSRRAESGFTLFELLIVVILMGLATAIAIPNAQEWRDAFNALNAESSVLQDIKRAQAQSITEGCRGIISIEGSGTGYTFGCDYLEYDPNIPPSHDVIAFTRFLPNNVMIEVAQPIMFNSRGQSIDPYNIISSNTVTLRYIDTGNLIGTGTLLGTGVFTFE